MHIINNTNLHIINNYWLCFVEPGSRFDLLRFSKRRPGWVPVVYGRSDGHDIRGIAGDEGRGKWKKEEEEDSDRLQKESDFEMVSADHLQVRRNTL